MRISRPSGSSTITALRTASWSRSSFSSTRSSVWRRSAALDSAWLISWSVVSLRSSVLGSVARFAIAPG